MNLHRTFKYLTRLLTLAIFAVCTAFFAQIANAANITVDGTDVACVAVSGQADPTAAPYCNIQDAVTDALAGDTITVNPSTYTENIVINKDIVLLSSPSGAGGGAANTIIEGVSSAGALGTLVVTGGTTNVDIGAIDQGFTIVGIDNGNPAIENAALYFQGGHSGATVIGNEIVAQGEAGLLTEYGQPINNFTIQNNTFSGKTFVGAEPGGCGFGSQFTTPNVPRQLVVFGNGGGDAATASATNINFSDNTLSGDTGGVTTVAGCTTTGQGNTLATIDAANSTIANNNFDGTTARFATSLRVRRPDTAITGNTFASANFVGSANAHIFFQNASTFTLGDLITGNTFDRAVSADSLAALTDGYVTFAVQPILNVVPAGDTVNLLAGTYVETLEIDKELTLTGAGVGLTILDVSFGTTWGVNVTADDVSISALTVEANSNGTTTGNQSFCIHVFNVANIALDTLEVNCNRRTGVDLNTVDGATVSSVSSNGAYGGFGFNLASTTNATLTDVSTMGNAWGSVGIFPSSQTGTATDNVVFDGTVTLAEGGFVIQPGPTTITFGTADATDATFDAAANVIVPAEFDQHIFAERASDSNGTNILATIADDPVATAQLLATLPAPGNWNDVTLRDLSSGEWQVHSGMFVQTAVDAASAADTVVVNSGIYTESVMLDKALTLKGDGTSPLNATLRGSHTVDASDVTVDGLILTNPGQARAVLVDDETPSHSNIVFNNNSFQDIGFASVASNTNVQGVYLESGPDNVTFSNNTFMNISGGRSVNAILVGDSSSNDDVNGLVIMDNSFINIDSPEKGSYGILINNGAIAGSGVTNAPQITGNSFDNLTGGWVHAVGLEGETPGAIVQDNVFGSLSTNAGGLDKSAIFFEGNPVGNTVVITGNQFTDTTANGVVQHPNDLTNFSYEVNAAKNWWGVSTGPSGFGTGAGAFVGDGVEETPWCLDPGCTVFGMTNVDGEIEIPAGSTADQIQAVLDAVAPGTAIVLPGDEAVDGGLEINTDGLTINLNGATIGSGSPAFTISAANVSILGPGALDGSAGTATGGVDPAILVQAGGDNFRLEDVEVLNWVDGVEVAADVTSLKIRNNYFHNNGDGLQFNAGVGLAGVVTIEGNLFKDNTGNGIQQDGNGTIAAQYNSWGALAGAAAGDGVSANVDASNHSFAELFVDVVPQTEATTVTVTENDTVTVAVKLDAAGLYGVNYSLTYSTSLLTLNSSSNGDFIGSSVAGVCVTDTATAGMVDIFCTRSSPDADASGTLTVTQLVFTADLPGIAASDNGPWTNLFDIITGTTTLDAATPTGARIYVNNGGFGAPETRATLTDVNDGEVIINGLAQFTGFIDLQGRGDDSGATVTAYDQVTKAGAEALASGTSASSGQYTTSFIGSNQLTVGSTYFLLADAPLYLPTTIEADTDYADSADLTDRATTSLNTVVLLGGDATDDNVINIFDASCIGGNFGNAAAVCVSGTSSSDVNGDGQVTILDLSLMGGNFLKTASDWIPQ